MALQRSGVRPPSSPPKHQSRLIGGFLFCGDEDPIGANGDVGVLHRAELEPRGVSFVASRNRLGASERVVGAGVGHEKRRWMRIFTISRLANTQKTRRSVRSLQRRDAPHPLDALHTLLLHATFPSLNQCGTNHKSVNSESE